MSSTKINGYSHANPGSTNKGEWGITIDINRHEILFFDCLVDAKT